jgi:signal transduction histidine kinase
MATSVITLPLRSQEDVLLTRRRARDLAGLLQLGAEDQSRLATAVWEVSRLALRHGAAAEVDFAVAEEDPEAVVVATISRIERAALIGEELGQGPERLDLAGLRQLVDRVEVHRAPAGVVVTLSSALEPDAWIPGMPELAHVLGTLQRHESGEAAATVNELRMQNAELMSALATVSERERELTALNSELTDTNRAINALLAELGQQADELRERASDTTRFLRVLTHELRTPLYAVRGMTESIVRDSGDELDAFVREDITLIDRAVEEALDLVNDHLDLARLQAGRDAVRLSDVFVDELFSALRGIVMRLPRANGVALVFEHSGRVPVLRTDRFKLGQILRNYVANALRFTEHGEVRVSASELDAGSAVRFAVADTGPGLDAADQARVFDEFVQLGSERGELRFTERGELRGSGLGLSICRRLATLLGGDVGVSSEPGRGTTFTATIPVVFPTDAVDVEVVEG